MEIRSCKNENIIKSSSCKNEKKIKSWDHSQWTSSYLHFADDILSETEDLPNPKYLKFEDRDILILCFWKYVIL